MHQQEYLGFRRKRVVATWPWSLYKGYHLTSDEHHINYFHFSHRRIWPKSSSRTHREMNRGEPERRL
jgi:hypothetical protein